MPQDFFSSMVLMCLEKLFKTLEVRLNSDTVSPCRIPAWSLRLCHEDFFFFYHPGGGTVPSDHLPRVVFALLLLVTLLLHVLGSKARR